jgi:superfamily II RNA helicase
MVKLCNTTFTNNESLEPILSKYPYNLSDFQKHAIQGILNNNHVLVTAHTGSGKTLPAEFSIEHWVSQGKKVIYTSPIKALSNQKFYEFTNKFPHISFGLFTGDIKTNPEADVLIMTTEILMNRLFNQINSENSQALDSILQFQMDFEQELAAVIFDEVHYINDADRGQVWEKTILMLPEHIQMIMLSATMDKPEMFGNWIERSRSGEKEVVICPTNMRVVPLSHYGYMAIGEHEFKHIKDKPLQQQMRKNSNKPIKIKDSNGQFILDGYKQIIKMDEQLHKQKARLPRKFVLNNLAKYLHENEMTPAICFVFSRKQVESCAQELTVPLLETDSKIPYLVENEANQILRRLPNYEEYLRLPEYITLIGLLGKGVGIHHSGMIPILREIVELFISKKYIKVLFATESFAIGLDCPIKTTVFTGITKYDGDYHRLLHSHEYTQMAGRAGRRGIDTVGYVIHCNNLFRNQPSEHEYKTMLGGKPPTLFSKFKLDYSLVFNILKSQPNQSCSIEIMNEFIKKSMFHDELNNELTATFDLIQVTLSKQKSMKDSLEFLKTPKDICQQFLEKQNDLGKVSGKKRKIVQKDLEEMKSNYKSLEQDIQKWKLYEKNQKELQEKELYHIQLQTYSKDQLSRLCSLLEEKELITVLDDKAIKLSTTGELCSHIAEVHGPIWIDCMVHKWEFFKNFSEKQLVGLFSCATDIKVDEEYNSQIPHTNDLFLKEKVLEMKKEYEYYESQETARDIRSGIRYDESFTFTILEEAMAWCDCENEAQCKEFISEQLLPKGISLGDFSKAMMKVATIAKEFRSLSELDFCKSQTEWLHKLTAIEEMVLKYIATNQSLYV